MFQSEEIAGNSNTFMFYFNLHVHVHQNSWPKKNFKQFTETLV